MKVNGVGGSAHINMGVVSRPMVGFGDGSDHDNGRRAHGKPDSFRSDFRSLVRAVKSGDMTSAQSALATIKSDVASASATYTPMSTAAPADSPIGADLKALFDAVGSGDAASAQSALAKFAADRREAWQSPTAGSDAQASSPVQGHHGRRHYGLESLIASLFTSSSTDAPSTDAPPAATTDATSTDAPPVDTPASADSAAAPETVAA